MKNLPIALTLTVGLCLAIVWLPDACGQEASPAARSAKPANSSRIAVVDIDLVLRQYARTAEITEQVKSAVENASAKDKEKYAKIQELGKGLKDAELDPESPEYRKEEKKITQLSAEFTTSRAITEKELKQREAKAVLSLYQDAREAVRVLAEENGYAVVLRINREAVAAKNYATVQQSTGQFVIRHDGRDDITDAVIAYLNHQYEAAAGDSKSAAPLSKPAADAGRSAKAVERPAAAPGAAGTRKGSAR